MRDFQAHVSDSLGSLGIPGDREAAIIEEIAGHMCAAYEEALASGLSETEALRYAESAFVPWDALNLDIRTAEGTRGVDTREIGRVAFTRQKGSRKGAGQMLANLWQDLRFGARTLFRRPLFTGAAIVTLGLGIGSTTTIFSVVDGVLIRDLPYRDPDRLVSVWKAWPSWQDREGLDYMWDHVQFPWVDYQNLKNHATTLTDVAAFMHADLTLTGSGEPERISVGRASENLFDLLGVRPVLGRAFLEEEVPPLAADEGGPVALLSHELWSRRFGRDRGVLGRTVVLDGTAYEVVGVLPPGFRVNSDMMRTQELAGEVDPGLRDVWIPLRVRPDWANSYEVLARLEPGASVEQARSEVQVLMTTGPDDQVARVETRKEFLTKGFGTPLLLLMGGAGLLLLVACVNVAGLLVSEATERSQEVALRHALGAGRGRVVGQLLTENVLLGVMGAALGVVLAALGVKALLSVAPPLPRLEEVALNGRVLLFAVGAGVGTSLLFGLAPTSTLAGHSFGHALRSRGQSASCRGRSIQMGVVSTQVALTAVLLVAGGLFGRSFWKLLAVDPGFDAEGLVAIQVGFPQTPASTVEGGEPGVPAGAHPLLDVVRTAESVPGVVAATATSFAPFGGGTWTGTLFLRIQGEIVGAPHYIRFVLPNYHEVMGIPLKDGRYLTFADGPEDPRSIMVSEGLAAQYWPAESPVGVSAEDFSRDEVTIVGVVGDVRKRALGSTPEATFYFSILQYPQNDLTLVVKTAAEPSSVIPSLRTAIRSVDPSLVIGDPTTLTALANESEADNRFRAILTFTFAVLATALAAVGIFGITARGVATRTQELGIRMALGADPVALIGHVVRSGMMSAAVGLAAGLVGAFWAARLIQQFLFGIESSDPATYLGVSCILMIVCLFAAYLPASRVTRIAPMEVITEE